MIAFLVYVADLLLGCALGFVAQPSFWINILSSDERTQEVQAARTAAGSLNDMKNGALDPSGSDIDNARADIDRKLGQRKNSGAVGNSFGDQRVKNAVTKHKPSAATETKAIKAGVTAAQSNTPMRSKMWKAMKGGLKGLVPCLVACLAGLAMSWVPGFGVAALAAAAGAFFSCMGTCVVATLGENLGFLVFELVSSCLWDILGESVASVCFPADATVQLEDGRQILMKELQVGDRVRSSSNTFSEVYLFSHKMETVTGNFVEISTKTGHKLQISPKHFILVSPNCDTVAEHMYASSVHAGMCVHVMVGGDALDLARVVDIKLVRSQGLYNPFTMDGDILVDGVLASAHSEWFLDSTARHLGMTSLLPSVYQATLAPARGLYHLVGAQVARIELEKYQDTLNSLTDENALATPYLDLAYRAWQIMTSA